MQLAELTTGQRGRIDQVLGLEVVSQRLMEMGLLEGEEVEVVGFAPLGDPMEIRIHHTRLSLRKSEAAQVAVTLLR